MSIRTSEVKVGDVLHDIHSERMGNTKMRCEGHWTAKVVAVAEDGTWADASWNGNRVTRHYGKLPWKRWPKEWYRSGMGGDRTCAICRAQESDGHAVNCEHPRAIAARKRAAKAGVK